VLILAAILGTSTVVRLWPVDVPAPLLASRPIHLYEAPVLPRATPEQLPTVRSVRLQADRISPPNHLRQGYGGQEAGHYVRMENAAPAENTPLTAALPIPQEITAVAVQIDAPIPVAPVLVDEPLAIANVPAPDAAPMAAVVEAAPPVPTSSRGIVELPAVAVTRAVTVAGRGIMTGLRATGAIFRAAF
jgi:hypothetical protein